VAKATTDAGRIDSVNLGPMERRLSMVAGSMLAAWGLRRRDSIGGSMALGAAALLYRGTTGHCHVYDALGVDRGRHRGTRMPAETDSDTRERLGGSRGIHVEATVTINRPKAEVFRFWRNFENLPTFMEHLEEVAVREEGISHWVARGPAGMRPSWDARIINEVDDKLIAWQSLEGSSIATAGSVNFDETDHGTRVRINLQYDPPGGRLGAIVARLFGEDPRQTVREDLRRFKQLLETGEIPTTDGQPSGRRTMAIHPSAKSGRGGSDVNQRPMRAGAGR
jgi:uncharacterized membrane protein